MRIQVECRRGAEPRVFFVGGRRLHVMRILERNAEGARRRFRVRVHDARVFVLHLDVETGEWTLVRIDEARRHASRL